MADIRITPASSVMSFTSSLNYIEKLTQDASGSLNLYGSGSTGRTELLSIDGNNGRLFTVSDDLSDSLFSVNTIAGLPVIEAFADNSVNIGQYSAPPIRVTGSLAIITGSLFGTASWATVATSANQATSATVAGKTIQEDTGGTGNYYMMMTQTAVGGDGRSYNTSNQGNIVYYDADEETLWSNFFKGDLTGTATNATNATVTTSATNSNFNIPFANTTVSTTGNYGLLQDSQTVFTYNPFTNTLISPNIEVEANTAGIYNDGGDLAIGDWKANDYATSFYGQGGNNLIGLGTNVTQFYRPIHFTGPIGTSEVNGEVAYWGGGTVVRGDLYYYNSSGNWALTDADAASTATGMLGIARADGTASTVGMLLRGRAKYTSNSNYNALSTIGAPLYISTTPGGFTQTAPTGTGDIVRIIGYVLSTASDEIYFCPDSVWVEVI
jgi:hypothetical protein